MWVLGDGALALRAELKGGISVVCLFRGDGDGAGVVFMEEGSASG